MCGIVDYLGNENAVPALLEDVRRLENRGYDSAGLAVQSGAALSVFRSVGKVETLAYHMAVLRGCDVDQPRNLAKSVTVE